MAVSYSMAYLAAEFMAGREMAAADVNAMACL